MKSYAYVPEQVCSTKINFSIDDVGNLHDVKFVGGCPGNLSAISKLVEGKNAEEIANILCGNLCGKRPTSCADQLSHAIYDALND